MQNSDQVEDDDLNWVQAISEWTADAVIFADRDGAVRIWNRGAEAIFGYSASEALNGGLDLIIPERFRNAHWEGYRRAIETGHTRNAHKVLTTRSEHKDGSKLYVDLSFGLVRTRAGSVAGALAIGRDCTARYLSDRTLRARVQELERALASGSATNAAPAT